MRGHRQDIVCDPRGGRLEQVRHDEQVQALQRREHRVGVLQADERIAVGPERAHGVGLAGQHRVDHLARMRIGRGDRVRSGEQRELVGAQLLLEVLVQPRALARAVVARHAHRGRQEEAVVPGLVDAAGERGQEAHQPQRGDGVAAHGRADEGVERGGLGGREHLGGAADVLRRYPGDLLDALGRVGRGALGERVESRRPFVDEAPVVPAARDQDVNHAQCERGVGAGADPQPQRRLARRLRRARVDHDRPCALLLRVAHALVLRAVGLAQVDAPEQDHLRALHVGEAGIGDQIPERQHVRHELRGETLVRVVLEESRAADRVAEQVVGEVFLGRQRLHRDRGRSVRVDDRLEARGDVVERLVPGDTLPLSGAALADPLLRIDDAMGRERQVERGLALDAQIAFAQGMALVADDPLDGSVLGLHLHPAANEAETAVGRNGRVHVRPWVRRTMQQCIPRVAAWDMNQITQSADGRGCRVAARSVTARRTGG